MLRSSHRPEMKTHLFFCYLTDSLEPAAVFKTLALPSLHPLVPEHTGSSFHTLYRSFLKGGWSEGGHVWLKLQSRWVFSVLRHRGHLWEHLWDAEDPGRMLVLKEIGPEEIMKSLSEMAPLKIHETFHYLISYDNKIVIKLLKCLCHFSVSGFEL